MTKPKPSIPFEVAARLLSGEPAPSSRFYVEPGTTPSIFERPEFAETQALTLNRELGIVELTGRMINGRPVASRTYLLRILHLLARDVLSMQSPFIPVIGIQIQAGETPVHRLTIEGGALYFNGLKVRKPQSK